MVLGIIIIIPGPPILVLIFLSFFQKCRAFVPVLRNMRLRYFLHNSIGKEEHFFTPDSITNFKNTETISRNDISISSFIHEQHQHQKSAARVSLEHL